MGKREVDFLLKTQREFSGSFGRTRSRKFEESNGRSDEGLRKKRFKGLVKNDVGKVLVKENVENCLVDSPIEKPQIELVGSGSERERKGLVKNDVGKVLVKENFENCLVDSPIEKPQIELVGSGSERERKEETLKVGNDCLGKPVMEGEKKNNLDGRVSEEKTPLRRFTRSALKRCDSKSSGVDVTIVETPINIGRSIVAEDASNGKQVGETNRSTLESVEVEGNQVHKDSQEKPVGKSVNFSLELTAEPGEDNEGRSIREDETNVGISNMLENNNEGVRKSSELVAEPHEDEGKSAREKESNVGIIDVVEGDKKGPIFASKKKPVIRFTRSVSKITEVPFVTEEVVDASSKKISKRLSRSALECRVELMAIDGAQKGLSEKTTGRKVIEKVMDREVYQASQDKSLGRRPHKINHSKVYQASQDKSLGRHPRSTLKSKAEQSGVSSADTLSGCSISTVSEDACVNGAIANSHEGTADVGSQMRTSSKKKLEMKMSKKIALTNPSRVRELLGTGMLEGLSVKYVFGYQKKEGLQGTIKNCGILCSCNLCKGFKVVSPIQFEKHAGSTNRNPAYYIYFDNGKNLQDVLYACKDAPSGMLEATIQSALSSSPVDNAICLTCKRPLPVLRTRRKVSLCNLCLESQKLQASPVHTASMPSRTSEPEPAVTPKPSGSTTKCISKRSKSSKTQRQLKSNPILTTKSSDSMVASKNRSHGKLTRKDLGLHKLVYDENVLPEGAELTYYAAKEKILVGYKKGFGILCTCCNEVISASLFESHAGFGTRRKPYLHIFTSNGVSLHELSLSQSKDRKLSVSESDDVCSECMMFGDLLLCDGCPRAFHIDCAGESDVPVGEWYCRFCQQSKKLCAQTVANAEAAGRVLGVDPIEQISKRCIRIVETPEIEVGGCTLCRSHGFSGSGFDRQTIIICDQCEKEFHVGCLKEHGMGDLKELPEGQWFCSVNCSRIHSALHKLINHGQEKLPLSILKVIKDKGKEKFSNSNLDICWRFLSGKMASPENQSLLSEAVDIFHDRFDPIVDSLTGSDLIPIMVYGKNMREQDFGGMFCAVLTVNSSVVSAGILRILGHEFAELPLVATRNGYQGQGYFQALFSCIERLLAYLNVKNLILPSARGGEAIWTEKFDFKKMSDDQMNKYKRDYQITVFQGISMLRKPVPPCRVVGSSEDC